MTDRAFTELFGKWAGWIKIAGGSRYSIEKDNIRLDYNIQGHGGRGYYNSSYTSSRPWCLLIDGKAQRDGRGSLRLFASKEGARAAAEKILAERA